VDNKKNPSTCQTTTLDLNWYQILCFSAWRHRDWRLAFSPTEIGVFATSDWRSLQQRAALPVFQRMLMSGKSRLEDCLYRERVSFSASQLWNSHVKKLDNTSHTYEIDFADQNLWAEAIYWPQNAYFFQTELHAEEGVSVKVSQWIIHLRPMVE